MNASHAHGPEELSPLNDGARIAVMSVQIGHISDTLVRIEAQGAHAVPRHEWEQRNVYVDARFVTQAAEFSKLQSDIASRRAPWWTIVATIGGLAAMLALAVEYLPRIVN